MKPTEETPQNSSASWEKIFSSFADSEGFEEAMQLGLIYRRLSGTLLVIALGSFFTPACLTPCVANPLPPQV